VESFSAEGAAFNGSGRQAVDEFDRVRTASVATGSRDTLENVSCSDQLRLDPVATARGSDTIIHGLTASAIK
jgi:hypothetical protein